MTLLCGWCKTPFVRPHQKGPAPRWCSDAHRQAAFRGRKESNGASGGGFSTDQLHVIEWAAQECAWQMSGELSVGWMLRAWNVAVRLSKVGPPTEEAILRLGAIVEPQMNNQGYRQVRVRVGSDIKGDWRNVPRQMESLVDAWDRLTADEWFYEYEMIHPFRDGNGRTGNLMFNWRNGTLDRPSFPPNLFSDPRRDLDPDGKPQVWHLGPRALKSAGLWGSPPPIIAGDDEPPEHR